MNAILQFFKNLFSSSENKVKKITYSLGAFLNEPDNRDIPLASLPLVDISNVFPAHMEIQNFLSTPRLMQGNLGTCVSYAMEFMKRVSDATVHSRRIPYVITRNALGWTEANGQGLPQRKAAQTFTVVGTPKETSFDDNTLPHPVYASLPITDAMRTDANVYRQGGFAFPDISVNGLKQALKNGHMIAVTIAIDWDELGADGTVHPPINIAGYHEVVIGQSDDASGKFRSANWWPTGDLYINYTDVEDVIFDAIVFADIPENLVTRAQQNQYIFTGNMKANTTTDAIGQLQKRLALYGLYTASIDRNFGLKTLQAVKDYQALKGLVADGIVGAKTILALNTDVGNVGMIKTKLDLWFEAAVQMEGADPSHCNRLNIRYIGQKEAIGHSPNGFCIFPDNTVGDKMGRDLLIRAASGNSSNYSADETIKEFYAGVPMPNRFGRKIDGFAPASDKNDPDNYANFVAKHIGVDPNVQIKILLS